VRAILLLGAAANFFLTSGTASISGSYSAPSENSAEPAAPKNLPTWNLVAAPDENAAPRKFPNSDRKFSPSGFSGIVLDARGAPAARVAVTCRSAATALTGFTDERGGFAFDLASGDWVLSAATDSEASEELAFALEPGERLEGLELTLGPVFVFGLGNFF
jgi:hypothetical protein